MNAFLEGYAYSRTRSSTWYPGYLCYNTMGDIAGSLPGPVNLFVTAEEHPDCIDDAWLITDPTTPKRVVQPSRQLSQRSARRQFRRWPC